MNLWGLFNKQLSSFYRLMARTVAPLNGRKHTSHKALVNTFMTQDIERLFLENI